MSAAASRRCACGHHMVIAPSTCAVPAGMGRLGHGAAGLGQHCRASGWNVGPEVCDDFPIFIYYFKNLYKLKKCTENTILLKKYEINFCILLKSSSTHLNLLYSLLFNKALYKISQSKMLEYFSRNICACSYSEFLHASSCHGQYLVQKFPWLIPT
jgi:hypothetical protein